MIFIAKNYKGKVIGIVSAKSVESANAYWQGKGVTPHKVTEFDLSEDRENENMGYVTPIVTTKEEELYVHNAFRTFLIIE